MKSGAFIPPDNEAVGLAWHHVRVTALCRHIAGKGGSFKEVRYKIPGNYLVDHEDQEEHEKCESLLVSSIIIHGDYVIYLPPTYTWAKTWVDMPGSKRWAGPAMKTRLKANADAWFALGLMAEAHIAPIKKMESSDLLSVIDSTMLQNGFTVIKSDIDRDPSGQHPDDLKKVIRSQITGATKASVMKDLDARL